MKATQHPSSGIDETEETRRYRRLEAFNPAFRRDIERLMQVSPELEDLADSFPGLLFALATGYGKPAKQRASIQAIRRGLPLQRAAMTLSLPWWLRRLPPAAYTHKISMLPRNVEFSRHVVDLIPTQTSDMGPWLWAIEHGYRGCHWHFALWAARWLSRSNRVLASPGGENNFRFLTAWAWHAEREGTPGHQLVRKPWSSEMGLRKALDEVGIWRRRVALAVALNSQKETDWLTEGSANGYEFVALQTPEDFIRESDKMENCLDQFSDHMEGGLSRIFSIRKKGRTVANLEVAPHDSEPTIAGIRQLRGRRNHKARPEVWRAAYTWLSEQPLRPPHAAARRSDRARTQQAALELWLPYLEFLDTAGLAEEFAASAIGLKPIASKRLPKRKVSL
ncbi:protein of unknown function [Candidatus Filomicrobium marinum]|uniref:Uncharacterized protein n=2 Tax=Filomicrobium TaxID=119044 RepID=A0A0D6JL93_9HYPH|nr:MULTISPECIES: PcfJ domain-containing protein [Filomicrobium]MCV0369160.1 PcfJ domain-containing protein [Filomicrobium sp.]CFX60204.1 protein of unknown function [Candidatus Filomicrobium marinum]CPR22405.1 protein of unknown function [Candidatus Filomicrobium marinum]SDO85884.1 PcfJ-like protein [Filomicrobium insigne]